MKLFNYYCSSIIMIISTGLVFAHYNPVCEADKQYKSQAEKIKLFNGVNCKYCNELKIKYPKFNQLDPKKHEYYIENPNVYDENSKRYSHNVQRHYLSPKLAPMYLKWISNIVGYGVFAAKNIKKGDFIGEYFGVLREMKRDCDNLDYAWYYTLDGVDGEKLIVDGKDYGNELRFINHSNNPNTSRIDVLSKDNILHIVYKADRDIPKDTELTVSYGQGYFTSRQMKIIEN